MAGCKSPNSKKTASSLTASAPEHLEHTNQPQTPQDSIAIQTAKKLKRIIDSNKPTPSTSQTIEVDDTSKRPTIVTPSAKGKSSQISHMQSKPIKKQKRVHEYHDSGDENENVDEVAKKDEPKASSESEAPKENSPQQQQQPDIQWAREEDRLLLEQIKAGLDSNAEDIAGFAHQFPNKTQEQIKHRIDFLIDFLTKFKNKK